RFQAPAVQLLVLWYRRARNIAAALARALSQRPSLPPRADPAADREPGPHSASAGRPAGARRPGRPSSFRPGSVLADLDRRFPLEIEKRAVSRAPGAGPGAAYDRRRPHDF